MLTASHVAPFGAPGLGQIDITGTDLVKVALALSEAAKSGAAIANQAVAVLDTLPQRLTATIETSAETAGRGAGRGFGRGFLPPILLGIGAIMLMALVYRSTAKSLDLYPEPSRA